MNKEVKEIIDRLKDNANSDDVDEKGYFFALYISEKDLLLDYINRLEKENKQLKIQVSAREEVANKYKEVIDKAIEFSNKNWGTWCTHHLEYMTELQNILKEASK